MAPKNWKEIRKNKIWRNDKLDETLIIGKNQLTEGGKIKSTWYPIIRDAPGHREKTIKIFETKAQALKFAKSYMRKQFKTKQEAVKYAREYMRNH